MTLTTTDNKTLERWFIELQTLEKGSEAYLALRDRIYSYVYRKLKDMLCVKVKEWNRKYCLEEDDCISIYHDALLRCVEKYQPKRVKFITYFWQACENTAKNYYKKYRRQRRIPLSHLFRFDLAILNGQSDLLSTSDTDTQGIPEETQQFCELSEQLKNLYDTDQYKQDMNQVVQDNIISLLPLLSPIETQVFEKVIEGHTLCEISKLLNLRVQRVGFYVSRIQQKATKVA